LLLGIGAVRGVGAASDEDNPHEKMTRSKSVCLDCHTKVPKAGEHAPDYSLVDTPSETCLGCHGEYEHAGVHEHVGQPAEPLLGDENGKIACFTCHDPHPSGVLEGRTVYKASMSASTRALLAARTLPASVEPHQPSEALGALLRVPMGDPGCPTCHASWTESSWREKTLWSDRIRVLPRY
jgi:hypothetical protein